MEVPNLASEADREQQFEPNADIDSRAELRCRHVPMYLRVNNSVLQYGTSFVKSVMLLPKLSSWLEEIVAWGMTSAE